MKKVLSVNGQPLNVSGRIPRLSWRLQAGHSYFAFSATTQIVTQKTNDKKSYSSISNAPFQTYPRSSPEGRGRLEKQV